MSHHRKESKLKASIHDFVGPLLKRLKEEVPGNSDIITDIEKIKNHLDNRENWDRELATYFGQIERQIESLTEQKKLTIERNENKLVTDQKDTLDQLIRKLILDLKVVLEDVEQIQTKSPMGENGSVLPLNRPLPGPEGQSNSSNQDTEGFMEFLECMKSLNPQLRNCLYSLSVFPENTELKKRLVVYWWIGLGLVPLGENRSRTAGQLGEIFFSDLVDKGVLIPVVREHNQVVDRCTIKPIIHRQLISACEKKGLLKSSETINNSEEMKEGTLCIYGGDNSNLKALLNLNKMYLNSKDIISEKDMQVVQLGRWQHTMPEVNNKVEETSSGETKSKDHIEVDEIEFLQNLGDKVTYLSLGGVSRIEELHESIGKLENLMILDLRACHNLEKLPQKPRSKLHQKLIRWPLSQESWFKKLTHLDISECYLLDHIPKWVCELSNLEVLKGFVVGRGRNKSQSCGLQDISKLSNIRKLSIRIATSSFNTEDFIGLEKLKKLLVLTITWGESGKAEAKGGNQNSGEAEISAGNKYSIKAKVSEGDKEAKIDEARARGGEASEDNKYLDIAEAKGGETSEGNKEAERAEAMVGDKESGKTEVNRGNKGSIKAEASEVNKEFEIVESRGGNKDYGKAEVSEGNKGFVKGVESESNKELEIVRGAEASEGNKESEIAETREGNKDSRIAQTSEGKKVGKAKANRGNKDSEKSEATTKDDNKPTKYFPINLEKLDIRCYPEAEFTKLNPAAELKNLKRLYIRGGMIKEFTDNTRWPFVETLRLRFLNELEIDWYKLTEPFKNLKCVEYVNCPKLKNFPKDKSCWRTEIDGPFESSPTGEISNQS